MTKTEFNQISKITSPKIAKQLQALEKCVDEHCIKVNKIPVKRYSEFKKIFIHTLKNEFLKALKKKLTTHVNKKAGKKVTYVIKANAKN